MHKRILALLLVLCGVLYGCAPAKQAQAADLQDSSLQVKDGQGEQLEETRPLVLGYERPFFRQHPCTISDTGKTVVPLLYDGLVRVDERYQWSGLLAQSIESQGNVYRITLREDACFSDGQPVTAQDVAASLQMAMSPNSAWAIWLAPIQEYRILGDNSLQITTNRIQHDFENLLTFPIARQQADGTWMGCGRYRYDKKEGGMVVLQKNEGYWGQNDGPKEIYLQELPNSATGADSLKIGKISCMFDDLQDDEAMNLSNRNQAVDINHIVFLGANCIRGAASDPLVRQAVHRGIDRDVIVDRSYASKAQAADTPFNPSYAPVSGRERSLANAEDAQQLLEKAGYQKDSSGMYRSDLHQGVTLLYNSENPYRVQTASILQQQLGMIGLEVILQGVPYEEYMQLLGRGEFDLYIGELEIGDDMDIRRLFTAGEGYGYGMKDFAQLDSLYELWQQGQGSLDSFLWSYLQELPCIPLLYRQGIVAFAPQVSTVLSPCPSDIFAGLRQ